MGAEKIYINGQLAEAGAAGVGISALLRGNYVYASVHCDNHRPMWLERQLHYATLSYIHLYGSIPVIDAEQTEAMIADLLPRNRKPLTGNVVNIFIIPPKKGSERPDIIVAHDRTTIYHGYTVRSLRPGAVIANYEIPFAGHRTAVSMTAARYMEDYALRQGAKIALRANRSGCLVSSGDFPILAVRAGQAFTPPAEAGAGESVEREIMLRACKSANIPVAEREIKVADIPDIEEIMVFSTEGVSSVLSCSGHYFYNLVCNRIEEVLAAGIAID